MQPPAAPAFPVALFFGVMALGALGWCALLRYATRSARSTALTSPGEFGREVRVSEPAAAARPRLSPGGGIALLFAAVAAALGAGITWVTLASIAQQRRFEKTPTASAEITNPGARPGARLHYRFEVGGRVYEGATDVEVRRAQRITVHYLPADPSKNRPAQTTLPASIALVAPLIFDLAFVLLALKLRRDYVLARRGRLTTGKVVAYAFGGRGYSVLAYYDFANAQSGVTRGRSLLSNYTSASPYLKTPVGSGVEVLYLAERPQRNGLKLGLWWRM